MSLLLGCDTNGRPKPVEPPVVPARWQQTGTTLGGGATAANTCSVALNHERVFGVKANRCLPWPTPAATVTNIRSPDRPVRTPEGGPVSALKLTTRQEEILVFIDKVMRERGYPPSVREIGEAVGLTSPSTVHSHLATLQKLGCLRRDPTKPRAIEVRYDPASGAVLDRAPVRHVPLIGDVAAGTDVLAEQNVEELLPLPADLTGEGELFMLRVRGDSMVNAGIFSGDYVVVRSQPEAAKGDIVVAGIPGDEATVKVFDRRGSKIVLRPANDLLEPMEFDPTDVTIFGRVVTVLRKL